MEMVYKLIEELPPTQGEIIRRHYIDQEALADIAKSLDMRYAEARRVLKHGLKKLEKQIIYGGPDKNKPFFLVAYKIFVDAYFNKDLETLKKLCENNFL